MGQLRQSDNRRVGFRILDHSNTNPFSPLAASFCFCDFEYRTEGEFPMKLHLDGAIEVCIPMQLSRAVPKRKAEFVAGRFAALNAISKLKAGVEEISSGESGEPNWPRGFAGSITHTAKRAAAIVCRSDGRRWIGIDMEEAISLDVTEEIGPLILTPDERKTCSDLSYSSQIVTAIFSAKESIYKAIYPKIRRFVDFQEVECVHISNQIMQFRPAGRLGVELGGRSEIHVQYRRLGHDIVTLCDLNDAGNN